MYISLKELNCYFYSFVVVKSFCVLVIFISLNQIEIIIPVVVI